MFRKNWTHLFSINAAFYLLQLNLLTNSSHGILEIFSRCLIIKFLGLNIFLLSCSSCTNKKCLLIPPEQFKIKIYKNICTNLPSVGGGETNQNTN